MIMDRYSVAPSPAKKWPASARGENVIYMTFSATTTPLTSRKVPRNKRDLKMNPLKIRPLQFRRSPDQEVSFSAWLFSPFVS
jgi:hypothetical protein